jgi:protein-disulfide isomerase
MKQIIIIVLVVVAIITGAMFLGKDSETTVDATGSNNWYGQENGVITLTEYADFQCPACAQFAPLVSQVKEQFKDQIRFEFKHFPLVQIHPNATSAHRASQAAANQNKFWEMHDLLYQNQDSWSSVSSPASTFESYAQQISLNMDTYKSDYESGAVLSIINADIEAGKNLGVVGTPTFFIDGMKIEDIESVASVDGLTKVIQDAIDAKNNGQ